MSFGSARVTNTPRRQNIHKFSSRVARDSFLWLGVQVAALAARTAPVTRTDRTGSVTGRGKENENMQRGTTSQTDFIRRTIVTSK